MSSPINKYNPEVFRPIFVSQRKDNKKDQEKPCEEKVEIVQARTLPTPPIQSPISKTKRRQKISGEELARLRYAQASMKSETSDGISLQELTRRMMNEGFDENSAIRVVLMSPSKDDSPKKKLVAFDTRRTSAARAAAKKSLDQIFEATVEKYSKHDPAPTEYSALEHLTFHNKKIPHWVRRIWIDAWRTWHEDALLRRNNITVGTWGHLIKLRMAMSTDPSRRALSFTQSGFKKSPVKRPMRRPRYRASYRERTEPRSSRESSRSNSWKRPLESTGRSGKYSGESRYAKKSKRRSNDSSNSSQR